MGGWCPKGKGRGGELEEGVWRKRIEGSKRRWVLEGRMRFR